MFDLANQWMLLALAAAAIPIIIEWLFRRRRKRIEFPAMRYLMNPRKRKKIRMQDRVLLLVRTVALVLLAIALARPLVRPTAGAASTTRKTPEVIICIDGTYSMSQTIGETNPFRAAQETAQNILRGLGNSGSNVTLIYLGGQVQVVRDRTRDLDSVHDAIAQLRISDGAGRMADVVEKASAVVDQLPPDSSGEVYVISDMQRTTWAPTAADSRDAADMLAALVDRCAVFVLDTGGGDLANAYITGFDPAEKVMAVGIPNDFTVTIQAVNVPAKAKLSVTLFADEKEKEAELAASSQPDADASRQPGKIITQPVLLNPDGRATVVFSHAFVEPGEHLLRVELEGDSLPADNQRFYLATVPENVEVLVLDPKYQAQGDPMQTNSGMLAAAVGPPTPRGFDKLSRFRVTVRSPDDLYLLNLETFKVVVLANVGELDDSFVTRLEQYVGDGGKLAIWVGDRVRPYDYNLKLLKGGKGLLPCELGKPVGDAPADILSRAATQPEATKELLSLDYGRGSHAAVANVRAMTVTPAPPSIGRYMPANLAGKEVQYGTPVAFLSNGVPAICERSYGWGKVVLVNTSADDAWNFLGYTKEFGVLVQELLGWMVGDPDKSVNLRMGDAFVEPVMLSGHNLLMIRPGGESVEVSPRPIKRADLGLPSRPVITRPTERLPVAAATATTAPDESAGATAAPDAEAGATTRPETGPGPEPAPAAPAAGSDQPTEEAADLWLLEYGHTDRQGVYQVAAKSERMARTRFVVNMIANEGDLARLSSSVLDKLPDNHVAFWGPRTAVQRAVASRHSVTEYAWLVLWGIFCLLAAETYLATRFGRRRI